MLSLSLSDWFLKKEIQSTMAINYRITSTCLNEYWVHLKFGRHKVRTLRGQGRFPAQGELKNYRAKYVKQSFFSLLAVMVVVSMTRLKAKSTSKIYRPWRRN